MRVFTIVTGHSPWYERVRDPGPPGASSGPASGSHDPLDTGPNFVGGYEIAVIRSNESKPDCLSKTSLIKETINRLSDEVVRLPSILDSELREARFLIWVQPNLHGVTD